MDGAGFRSFSASDGLVHPSITSVTETRDGTIWVGSGFANTGGANRLTDQNRFAGMSRKDGLAGDKVRQIYEDRLGRLWFCSEYDGVAIFAGGVRQRILTTSDGLAGDEVKKIIEDSDGAFWLATDHGLNKLPTLK
jgi:ligand-binding sensor domain-containing protein